jgi:rhodanese-related sulfurtransferase
MQKNQIYDTVRAKAYFEDKLAFTTDPVELKRLIESGQEIVVVDVRAEEDFAKGHVPGAINLPKGTWENPQGLRKERNNIVYCYTQTCHLAAQACSLFAGKGYPVMEMEGGFEAWKDDELEIERAPESRLEKTGERTLNRRH